MKVLKMGRTEMQDRGSDDGSTRIPWLCRLTDTEISMLREAEKHSYAVNWAALPSARAQ